MPNVYAVNKTNSSIDVSSWNIYFIDSVTNTGVELITVYDQNNNKFDCFKAGLWGWSYYFVIDNIHNYWVSNVDSIGYSLTKILPSITTKTLSPYSYETQSTISVPSGGIQDVFNKSDGSYQPIEYDSSKAQVIYSFYTGNETRYGTYFDTVNSNNVIKAENISLEQQKVYWFNYAECTDPNVTIVVVYNAQYVPHYAFKYSDVEEGKEYYYVFYSASVAMSWVEDLSTIGFQIPSLILPMVVNLGRFGFGAASNTVSIAPDGSMNIKEYGSDIKPSYDTNSVYAVMQWEQTKNVRAGAIDFDIVNLSNFIGIKNITEQTISVRYVRVYRCMFRNSPVVASVINVYDSQDVPYHAFLYTINNTDYYYVLDDVQDNWTDNLSSIGYSLMPVAVLPTVNVDILFTNSDKSTAKSISSFAGTFWYDDNSANVMYQSGWTYLLIKYYEWTGDVTGSTNDIEYCYFEDRNGRLFTGSRIQNGSINVQRAEIASCSDSTVTSVAVCDTSNVAYNAFKYTESGTDYYYVLDGTQTDWTNDLASIGYHLPEFAYIQSSQSSISVVAGRTYGMYDENGIQLHVETGKTYTCVGCLDDSGNYFMFLGSIGEDTNGMYWSPSKSSPSVVKIQKVLYTVS